MKPPHLRQAVRGASWMWWRCSSRNLGMCWGNFHPLWGIISEKNDDINKYPLRDKLIPRKILLPWWWWWGSATGDLPSLLPQLISTYLDLHEHLWLLPPLSPCPTSTSHSSAAAYLIFNYSSLYLRQFCKKKKKSLWQFTLLCNYSWWLVNLSLRDGVFL